jgi:hypothetical protein
LTGRYAGIVHKDADRPQLDLGTHDHSRHRVGIGDIYLDCNDASARRCNFTGGCFRLRRACCIVDADRGAARCQAGGRGNHSAVDAGDVRRLAQLDRLTRAGKGWKFEPELPDDLGELSGRTVGLVGSQGSQ